MKVMFANGLRGAGIMTVFSVVFTALMAGAYALTKDIVRHNEETARVQLIAQTLPPGSYDNKLLADARLLSLADSQQLGHTTPATLYLAKRQGDVAAAVLEAVAPDGYAGAIKLLVAVSRQGEVLGVRVLAHRETPGLGDYIEATKSKWVFQFDGKSLGAPPAERWKVKKDGGEFDANAGATISPRAVVGAVKRTLDYVAAHQATIFSPQGGSSTAGAQP